jgi:hypothetical protein
MTRLLARKDAHTNACTHRQPTSFPCRRRWATKCQLNLRSWNTKLICVMSTTGPCLMLTLYTPIPGVLGSNFGWYTVCPLWHFSWYSSYPPHKLQDNSMTVSFQILSNSFITLPFHVKTLWSSFVKQLKENGPVGGVGGKSSWAPFLRETWVCSVKNVFAYTFDVSHRLQCLDVTANYSGRGFVSVIALIKVRGEVGGIHSPYTLASLNGHQWLSSASGASELGL